MQSISLNLFCRLYIALDFSSALHQTIFVLFASIHYIPCHSGKVRQQCCNQIGEQFGKAESQPLTGAGRDQEDCLGAQNCIIWTSLSLSQASIELGQLKILSFDLQKPLCIQVSEQGTPLDTDDQKNRDNAA